MVSAGVCLTVCAGLAQAATQWPPSIVGTWTGVANDARVTVVVASQAAAGESCKAITGTIAGDTLAGFYCPSDGEFSFVRFCKANGAAAQVYTGNLADGVVAHKGTGTVANVTSCFGAAGEFSFWMQK